MTQSAVDFVHSLELSEMKDPGALHLQFLLDRAEYPRAGYVDAGSIVSFVAGVSPQSQRDALNSTLLAQLAANQKYNRETDTVNWYSFYKTVLENVGWVVQDFNFTKLSSSGANFSMDKAVLDLIAAIASGGDDIAAMQATLDALRALPTSDGRLVLFDSSSHSASRGNFQIGVASEWGGVLAMRIGAFYFSTTQNVTNVLWFNFSSSSTDMYKGGQGMSLNKQIYMQVRAAIVQKLGDKAQRFVKNLDIG
jgi:hypothetical protein